MRIVVCIKQVPREFSAFTDSDKWINRGEISGIINPNDRVAIKFALDLREKGDEVISLTMGPPNSMDSSLETLAMGIDGAILLTDKRFAEADTLATSYALHRAIRKIGDVDIVICGSRTTDSETGHVGPQLAEFLGIPLLSYVYSLTVQAKAITVERFCDRYQEILEAELPALITISHRCKDRVYPTLSGLNAAFDKCEVTVWDADDIDADANRIGRKGSATFVERILTPEKQRVVTIINDDKTERTITKLFELLKDRNILLLDKVRSRRGFEGFDI
jgi:electron transfer flavoprotein beta subunit